MRHSSTLRSQGGLAVICLLGACAPSNPAGSVLGGGVVLILGESDAGVTDDGEPSLGTPVAVTEDAAAPVPAPRGPSTDAATDDTAASTPSSGSSTASCQYQANAVGLNAFQQPGGLAFHVYAPSTYNPNIANTVVIIMGGQDSDGTAEMSDLWQPIADNGEPLVLVVPKGSLPATDPSTYPTGANWSVDDLNHIEDLVGEIDDCYAVNVKKHILWGFSEGGFYGYLLGIGAASYFSGLAMGGSNTSFAQENGYAPSAEQWAIPVSHVQGTTDPNGLSGSIADQAAFEAAGSHFTLYEPDQGHTITPAQVLQQYNDLKASTSP